MGNKERCDTASICYKNLLLKETWLQLLQVCVFELQEVEEFLYLGMIEFPSQTCTKFRVVISAGV